MSSMPAFEPIKITGVVASAIGRPKNDGSPGSGLYNVPLQLSARPPAEWVTLFVHHWDRPRQFSSRHRPGIASVSGDRINLDGTTIEELEQVHKATLAIAIEDTNEQYMEWAQKKAADDERERVAREAQDKSIREAAKKVKFD